LLTREAGLNTLLVCYDLYRPGQDYDGLIEFLEGLPGWWHYLDSTWLVATTLGASRLRNELKGYVDANDEVLVINVTGAAWASAGFPEEANTWLHDNLQARPA
jgi:hypothetical protein